MIRELAKKCLNEKWYRIKNEDDCYVWVSDCAFCRDAQEEADELGFDDKCGICLIKDLPICTAILSLCELSDKKPIVDALEELADNGELTDKTRRLLEYYGK